MKWSNFFHTHTHTHTQHQKTNHRKAVVSLLAYLMFAAFGSSIQAQSWPTSCSNFAIDVCEVTEASPTCYPLGDGCKFPPGCNKLIYEVRLLKIPGSNTSQVMQLPYDLLTAEIVLNTTGFGKSGIDVANTKTCILNQFPGIDASQFDVDRHNLVINFEKFESTTPVPTVYFNSQDVAVLFRVVVDAFPGDQIDFEPTSFHYKYDLTSVNCSYPMDNDPLTVYKDFPNPSPITWQTPATVTTTQGIHLGVPTNPGNILTPVKFSTLTFTNPYTVQCLEVAIEVTSDVVILPPTIVAGGNPIHETIVVPQVPAKKFTVFVLYKALQVVNADLELFNIETKPPLLGGLAFCIDHEVKQSRIIQDDMCKTTHFPNDVVQFCQQGTSPCDPRFKVVVRGSNDIDDECQMVLVVGIETDPEFAYDLKTLLLNIEFDKSTDVVFGTPDASDFGCANGSPEFEIDGNVLKFRWVGNSDCYVDGGVYFKVPFTAGQGCVLGATPVLAQINWKEISTSTYFNCTITGENIDHAGLFPFCPPMLTGKIDRAMVGANPVTIGPGVTEAVLTLINRETTLPCVLNPIVNGCSLSFSQCDCPPGPYTFTPTHDQNPLNGISTFDLVRISKHVLNALPFTSAYQYIAADINHSSTVTTTDVVELRKLILGIYSDFPQNDSWRFVEASHQFNPQDIGDMNGIDGFIEFDFPSAQAEAIDFVGVKIGDLTGDALCDNKPADRLQGFAFNIPRKKAQAGEIIVLPVVANCKQSIIAFQAGFKFDPTMLAFQSVAKVDVEGITPGSFGLTKTAEGEIKVVWLVPDFDNFELENGQTLFHLAFKVLKDIKLPTELVKVDESVLRCEAYDFNERVYEIGTLVESAHEDMVANDRAAKTVVLSPVCGPNPTSGKTVIRWNMGQTGKATIWVFGPFGVRVFYKELNNLTVGAQELTLDGVENWPSGVYTCRIITEFADERTMLVKH